MWRGAATHWKQCFKNVPNKDQVCDDLENYKNLLCNLDLVEELHPWPHLAESILTMDDLIAVFHETYITGFDWSGPTATGF